MQKAALLGSLVASAYAHGRVVSINVDDKEYTGFTSAMAYSGADDIIAWSAENGDNGFVGPESYGSSDIACHKVCFPFDWILVNPTNTMPYSLVSLAPSLPLSPLVVKSSFSGTPGPSLTTVPFWTTWRSVLVMTARALTLVTSPSSRSMRRD
jgi:hypothetical protein